MTSPNSIIADLQAEIDALRKEREELIAALEEIADTAPGEGSHQYMSIVALDKVKGGV